MTKKTLKLSGNIVAIEVCRYCGEADCENPHDCPTRREHIEEDREPVIDNPGYRSCGCEDYPCCGH